MVRRGDPEKLLGQCETFVLKYALNVIWRQVDPGQWIPPDNLYKGNLEGPLPSKVPPVTDPAKFRQRFAQVREYLTENLIRNLHDALAKEASVFITENRLQHGDVLLRLLFTDSLSKTFELTAKHVIWRRWSVREEATLHRTIAKAVKLTKFVLPGKCTDKILSLLAQNCPNLETLDMSKSFVTDTGLLNICGIQVSGEEKDNPEQEIKPSRGAYCEKTGRWVRASKAKALAYIESLHNGENPPPLKKSDRLKNKENSLLVQKMKPFLAREDSSIWEGKPGLTYRFAAFGCSRLKTLVLFETVYPKKKFPNDVIKYGITREAVLATLILLPDLRELEWTKLGDILECFENVNNELGYQKKMFKLSAFTEQRPSVAKLEVAQRLCPNISRVSCSLFGSEVSEIVNTDESEYSRGVDNIFFDFERLRELELRHLDGSRGFDTKLETFGFKLTSLSLTETVSICFSTLNLIKKHCQRLKLLDIESYIFEEANEQSVQSFEKSTLPDLRLLRLGGSLDSGSALKYLISGCPELRVLAYHVYHGEGCDDHVTDDFIKEMLDVNPLQQLVAFYVDNCRLTERTFHFLVEELENLVQIGQLCEWRSLSEDQLDQIKLYVEIENIQVEVDMVDAWSREFTKIKF